LFNHLIADPSSAGCLKFQKVVLKSLLGQKMSRKLSRFIGRADDSAR